MSICSCTLSVFRQESVAFSEVDGNAVQSLHGYNWLPLQIPGILGMRNVAIFHHQQQTSKLIYILVYTMHTYWCCEYYVIFKTTPTADIPIFHIILVTTMLCSIEQAKIIYTSRTLSLGDSLPSTSFHTALLRAVSLFTLPMWTLTAMTISSPTRQLKRWNMRST